MDGDKQNCYRFPCASNGRAFAGAGGHRGRNTASQDIIVNYSGPDFANPSQCLYNVTNTNGSSRAVRVGALGTTAPVKYGNSGEFSAEKISIRHRRCELTRQ